MVARATAMSDLSDHLVYRVPPRAPARPGGRRAHVRDTCHTEIAHAIPGSAAAVLVTGLIDA